MRTAGELHEALLGAAKDLETALALAQKVEKVAQRTVGAIPADEHWQIEGILQNAASLNTHLRQASRHMKEAVDVLGQSAQ